MRRVDPPPLWWSAPDLRFVSERLCFGDRELGDIADKGTPVYVLRPQRAASQLAILKKAAPDFAVYYAIKANRHPLVIHTLRSNGVDGIDVCSPGEAQLAISNGFLPSQLSYTGTSVSRSDLDYLQANPDIHVNADSLSALRRLLETPRIPGVKRRTRVGLRINPELGLGYRQEKRLTYSGVEMSKFGILREQIDDACRLAKQYGAAITTLHWHVGCGWLHDQKEQVQNVVATGVKFAGQFPDLERINLGGGIGVPLVSDDVPVDLDAWSHMVRTLVDGRWQIMLEPGAFLVQNSTVLLVEVCTVEEKRGTWFIGINSGFNLLVEPVFYSMPSEIVPLRLPDSDRPCLSCRFAGNINEAHDCLPQTVSIPLPAEGDFFALLNAGAYGTSMASWHCLRGGAREVVVD